MPVLTDEEVNTVRESCRQLGAIGRNLNQVARALNIEFRESDKLKQEAIENWPNGSTSIWTMCLSCSIRPGAGGTIVIFRRRLHQLIGRNGCCAASS
uniref:plasmid mobilization relaxosome protein MobC n=1 Tax=Enterobacter cloacae TaxID=550 RepID=UPI00388EE249